MKILHVGKSHSTGGANEAMMRVHKTLQGASADPAISSHVFVPPRVGRPSQSDADGSADLARPPIFSSIEARLIRGMRIWARQNSYDLQTIPRISPTGLAREIRVVQPDIVNLHWVGKDMASLCDLRDLSGPVVWTLHDQWPLLGTRHYRLEDSRWTGLLRGWEKPSRGVRCLDTFLSVVKSAVYFKKFHFFAPSSWMADYALKRGIPAQRIHLLPHPLEAGDFGHEIRAEIPSDWLGKRAVNILFISAHGAEDLRKGYPILQQIVARLNAINSLAHKVNIWVVGHFSGPKSQDFGDVKISHLGIRDQEELRGLLDQVDLLFAPSVAEAFGLTVQEALVRGTKVMMLDGVGLSVELREFPGVILVPAAENLLLSISDTLVTYINHPERWNTDRKSISDRAKDLWSTNRVRAAYIEAYREVLS